MSLLPGNLLESHGQILNPHALGIMKKGERTLITSILK
jgi:hypothetical protein